MALVAGWLKAMAIGRSRSGMKQQALTQQL
jgi:hypothetical protein